MKRLALFSLALLSLASCNNSVQPGQTVVKISAQGTDELVISQLSPQAVNTLDTLRSEDGNFEYIMTVDTGDFFLVNNSGLRIPFYSSGGEQILIEIEPLTNAVDRPYSIKGNKESMRIKEVNDMVYAAARRIDSLGNIITQHRDSADFAEIRDAMQVAFETELSSTTDALMAIIDNDPGNLANLFIWPQSLANRQLIRAEEHFEYYEKVNTALQSAYPQNPHALNFQKQLENIRMQVEAARAMEAKQAALAPGKPAPEISMANAEGEILNLSDLKGQVVLIDFWAAWCRPCRAANPELVKVYNQYKDRGFTVMSVSLDGLPQQQNPREDWLKAIEQDGLSWNYHLSDLRGWSNAAAQLYGVQSIPFTVLVDREGNIVAKNVGPNNLGTSLEGLL